jgi:hypothetical protein
MVPVSNYRYLMCFSLKNIKIFNDIYDSNNTATGGTHL